MRRAVMCLLLTAGVIAAGGDVACATPATLHVVSLGDSFGSGTGAGDYEPGTEGQCWRSRNSYSEVVVAHLQADGRQVEHTNVTCSGAATEDLGRMFKGQPAQLDSLSDTTDLVTLSIGTNDVGFAAYGGLCIQGNCAGAPTEQLLKTVPDMGRKVSELLAEIHERSPEAKIVLTGYGAELSTAANPAGAELDPICGPDVFSPEERVQGNEAASAIDLALRTAASDADRAGTDVTFVSPYTDSSRLDTAFAGHSLCESGAPFYRGLDALAQGQEGSDALLHLNEAGQAALATLIEQKVPELTDRM